MAAVVVAVVFGGMTITSAFARARLTAWARRHPHLDGAMLGPFLFIAVAFTTTSPEWLCLLMGVAGLVLGVAQGRGRERRQS